MRSHDALRAYQHEAIDFGMEHDRGNIFAGMGMGKTISGLTVVRRRRILGELSRPTLALAPLRVARSTWPNEAREWDHVSDMVVSPIIGDVKQRIAAMKRDAEVYTINYENIPWLLETLGKKRWPFDMAIADESTKLKSMKLGGKGGVRARALARVAHLTPYWLNLTGTPTPKGLIDLWGQQWFVDQGAALGRTLTSFKERWFRQVQDGYGIEPMPHAFEEITSKLQPHCITLDPKDYFSLEEPIVKPVWVELQGKVRDSYRDMERALYADLAGTQVEVFSAAAKRIKLHQIANGFAYVDDQRTWNRMHGEKLLALESIVNEACGAPVMVAYWYKPDLAMLKLAFPKARELKTKQDEDDWNAGKIDMLLIHPASAGHGLNLQHGGNILAFYSLTDNLELYQQVLERIGPMRQLQSGYERNVFVYLIMARDTVDEDIRLSNEGKATLQEAFKARMKRRRV